MSEAGNLFVVDGPLSRHKLAVLRDERTPTTDFRQAMRELSLIMVAEATRRMPTRQESIRTPLTQTEVEQISGPVCLVPVLRAGLGMLDGALALLPRATVGFMGLQRDEETALPVEYYVNLPSNLEEYLVLVDLRDADVNGHELEQALEAVGVTCNKNMVPNDPESPTVTSGVRLGTPAMTTRGMGPDEMREIASVVCATARGETDGLRDRVSGLTDAFPLYE